MTKDFADMTALELAAGYADGTVRPSLVVEALEERIDRHDPAVNAIIARDRAALLAAAAASDARWAAGTPLSPLDGVPVTIKDNLHVAGLPARWGSRAHQGDMPEADEPAVARLRAAGLLILGKTNVPEFTLQGYTDNDLFGPTFNPLAAGRTPGGSTGGGAAAVAAGFGPIAIGTDGGGSIRRPAAHCGLWGLKPSIGAVARGGGFPVILHDFEVIGPVARSAEDLRGIMDILGGPDPADPRTHQTPVAPRTLPDRPRVHAFGSVAGGPVDPVIRTVFRGSLLKLRELGCDVVEGEEPFDAAVIGSIWKTVGEGGLAWHVRQHLDPSLIGENARALTEAGSLVSATDYLEALDGARRVRAEAMRLFETADLIISPTTAALAWAADQPFPLYIDGQPVGPRGHAVFTAWANVAGLPSINVPVGLTKDGGGIGLQVIAAPGADRTLIDFACSTLTQLAVEAPAPSRILP